MEKLSYLTTAKTSGDRLISELSPKSPQYLPSVDGLRAISILAVFAFHGVNCLKHFYGRSGWLGVDIFFVISGFLIARLAFAEIERTGQFDLRRFFSSRVLRISPAVWVMLSFCAIFNPFETAPAVNLRAVTTAALNLTDYDLALRWGSAQLSPLAICWSLAVEEKFYLLFPLLILFYKRFRTPALIAAVILAAEAWKAYLIYSGADWLRLTAAFDTRFDEILIGVFGACILSRQEKVWEKGFNFLAQPLATAAIAFATWYLLRHFMHPAELQTLYQKRIYWLGFIPAFASLVSLLLISLTCAQSRGRVGWLAKLLSIPPMLLVGRLSYSLYLWHSLAFFIVSKSVLGDIGLPSDMAKLALSLAMAAVSYVLIEKPFLEIKKRLAIRSLKLHTGSEANIPASVVRDSLR